MSGSNLPRATSLTAASLVLALLSSTADAQIHFDLRPQPMAAALTTVGNLAKINVLFNSAQVDGLWAPPLDVETSANDAVIRLLVGTRLQVVQVDANTISVLTEEEAKRLERARDARKSAVTYPVE